MRVRVVLALRLLLLLRLLVCLLVLLLLVLLLRGLAGLRRGLGAEAEAEAGDGRACKRTRIAPGVRRRRKTQTVNRGRHVGGRRQAVAVLQHRRWRPATRLQVRVCVRVRVRLGEGLSVCARVCVRVGGLRREVKE
jgi:hypothetical protein